jgi:hypothetical protein
MKHIVTRRSLRRPSFIAFAIAIVGLFAMTAMPSNVSALSDQFWWGGQVSASTAYTTSGAPGVTDPVPPNINSSSGWGQMELVSTENWGYIGWQVADLKYTSPSFYADTNWYGWIGSDWYTSYEAAIIDHTDNMPLDSHAVYIELTLRLMDVTNGGNTNVAETNQYIWTAPATGSPDNIVHDQYHWISEMISLSAGHTYKIFVQLEARSAMDGLPQWNPMFSSKIDMSYSHGYGAWCEDMWLSSDINLMNPSDS